MSRTGSMFLPAVLSLMVSLPGIGCTPNRQAVRSEKTAVAVRLPPAEAFDVRARPDRPTGPPELPYSVSDEIRGRWLTLFEVSAFPVSTGHLPENSRGEDFGNGEPGPRRQRSD